MNITTTTKPIPKKVVGDHARRPKSELSLAVEGMEAGKCLEIKFSPEALREKSAKQRGVGAQHILARTSKLYEGRKFVLRTQPYGFDIFRIS